MEPVARIDFRAMTEVDLPLFARWVKNPAVAEWWREEAAMSDEELFQKMAPRVLAENEVLPFIFSVNGTDAGYIQTYPETVYRDALELDGSPAGVDLFIGEEQFLHRGFGAEVLREFIRHHVFSDESVSYCLIDPELANTIAIRSYGKAGFRQISTFVSPTDGLTYAIMRLDRG